MGRTTMSALAIIYLVTMLGFGLLFFVDCVRQRKKIGVYVEYGVLYGAVLVLLDLAVVLLAREAAEGLVSPQFAAIEFLAFFKIVLFTCMGMHCCAAMNREAIPLTKRIFGKLAREGTVVTGNYMLATMGIALGGAAFSIVLFGLTSPRVSEILQELSETEMTQSGIGPAPSLMLALVLFEFAFAEEVAFRLGIQNYLAHQFKLGDRGYWGAIAMTAGLWSLAHASVLDPEWVKMAQIFPVGLALGILFKRFGIESCIFAHGVFNVIMMFLSRHLISW